MPALAPKQDVADGSRLQSARSARRAATRALRPADNSGLTPRPSGYPSRQPGSSAPRCPLNVAAPSAIIGLGNEGSAAAYVCCCGVCVLCATETRAVLSTLQGDPYACPGAERERPRRTLSTHAPRRLPRPDPHPWPLPPRARPPCLPPALQRTQAAPGTTPSPAQRPQPNALERGCPCTPSRPPRRAHPRIRGRLNLRTLRACRPPWVSTAIDVLRPG